jgi:hypothetical protein
MVFWFALISTVAAGDVSAPNLPKEKNSVVQVADPLCALCALR